MLIASKDRWLARHCHFDPASPVTVVSVEKGEEVQSTAKLRRHAHQQHQFLLIPDHAMAVIQVYNNDRTCRVLREFKKELAVLGRQNTLEKWKQFRLADFEVG